MTQKLTENFPYFSAVSGLLDLLSAKLKIISLNPFSKIDVSDSLFFLEKTKKHWNNGEKNLSIEELKKVRDSYHTGPIDFEFFHLKPSIHRFMSDTVTLLEDGTGSIAKKNQTAIRLWFDNVFYARLGNTYSIFLRLLVAFLVNFLLFPSAIFGLWWSFINAWHGGILVFTLFIALVIAGIFFLRFFPKVLTVCILILCLLFLGLPVILEINFPQWYPFLCASLFASTASLSVLLAMVVIVREHFLSAQYGKFSCVWLRTINIEGKYFWEVAITDTTGAIVSLKRGTSLEKVMYPLINYATNFPYTGKKQQKIHDYTHTQLWMVYPLFLYNPSRNIPKTTGVTWWLKSHGFWWVTPNMFFNPRTWEDIEKAGIKFSDEEIAEFLSHCPSPLQGPPGYDEYVALHGIEER